MAWRLQDGGPQPQEASGATGGAIEPAVHASSASAGGQPPLNTSTKLFYGVGAVALGVKDLGFSYMLLLFYNQVVGLPATKVGLALMIALMADAIIVPLIGHVSDNLRSPWGRRHPLMYAAALPVALCYAAVWNPPAWGEQALFLYLVVLAIVIRAFVSLYEVPSAALAAEFTTGYDERSVLLSFRTFFTWFGGMAITLVAFAVLLVPDATHPVGQLNPAGYALYGLVAAPVMFASIIISAVGTHRRIPGLRPPPAKRRLTVRQTVEEVVATVSTRSFLFLLASSVATAMSIGLAAALSNYFSTYFWGFSAREISMVTSAVFLSATLGAIAAPVLSRHFGKRATAMSLLVVNLVVGLGPILLRLAGWFPPNHSPLVLPIIFGVYVVGGTCGIVASIMTASMVADVVEAAELRTGRRSEGLFFAASAFVNRAVSGLGILTASVIIDAIGLKAGADPHIVPPDVIRSLAIIYCPAIIALYAVSILLLLGYSINRGTHEETLRRLAAQN